MSGTFSGKVAIVTGSSSGIGEGIAVKLAQRGACVVICGRDEQKIRDVLEKCVRESGGNSEKFSTFQGDLTESSAREKLIDQTIETFSRLDILIPNAGCANNNTIHNDTETDFDNIMTTNIKSVYFLIQKALPHLEKSKGNIVCVSSTLTSHCIQTMLAYQMSKAAVEKMVKTLAASEGSKGIRVNALSPGIVEGPKIFRDVPDFDHKGLLQFVGGMTPLHGRVSRVDEQADAALFLAGDEARFISGECLKVDGACSLNH